MGLKTTYRLTKELVGATVVDVGDDAENFPFLVVRKGKRDWSIYISRDEEQNGPGQPIIITEDPKVKDAT